MPDHLNVASLSPGHVTPDTLPIPVDPSKVRAVAITLGLALTATIGGASTVLSLAKERDLAGIVHFFQSDAAIPFIAGATTIAGVVGLVVRTIQRKAREVYLAYHTSDRIAELTAPIAPPAPPPVKS